MSFKNTMADIGTVQVQVAQGQNKIGKYVSIIISIILLVISLIAFLFNWKVGLVFLALSAMFYGFSRLAGYASRVNKRTMEKLQAMKEPNPNEVI